jgi:hypothetical protein
VALAVVVGVLAWVVFSRGGSSSNTLRVVPVKPIALSVSGLETLAVVVRQPIYWAGPRKNFLYELTRASNGNVYIRYLPPGAGAGAPGSNYLRIATYPVHKALEALKTAAGGRGIGVPGGGLALVDSKSPKSVHLAFPNVEFQAEVFAASPKQALDIATSGEIRPV